MENSGLFFHILRGKKKRPISYGKQNPGDTKIYQSLAYSIIKGGLNLRRLASLRLRPKSDLFPTLYSEGFSQCNQDPYFSPLFFLSKNFVYLIFKGNCLESFRKVSASPETKGTLPYKYRKHFIKSHSQPQTKVIANEAFFKTRCSHMYLPKTQSLVLDTLTVSILLTTQYLGQLDKELR